MNIRLVICTQLGTQRLLRNTAAVLIVLMIPSIAMASSWNPTLLVNTEAFQTIEDGDGSTNIELRFGSTGSGIQLNVTTGQFEFDTGIEVQGTASGQKIHAQDLLTTSGSLVVEEGQTVSLNGIEYLFPSTDDTNGFVLTTDGDGNLSWTNKTAGSLTQGSGDDRYVQISGDTMTGALTIDNEGAEPSLNVRGVASGQTIHAQDRLTSSGTLTVEGRTIFQSATDSTTFFEVLDADGGTPVFNVDTTNERVGIGTNAPSTTLDVAGTFNVTGNATLGDASGDSITFNAQTLNWANPISGTDNSVLVLNSSNNIVADEIDSRVWGSSLVDGTGNANRLARWSDSNTLEDGGISDTSNAIAITIDSDEKVGIGATSPDTELEVVGTISGSTLFGQDSLASSGTLIVEGGITFATLASCTNITTDANGVLSCNNTDYITELELDTEAELEAQLTDVTNVLTNNDDTDDLTEGSTNLYFTNERVDDQVAALLQAGSGITLSYDDTNGTLTINQGFSSGAQVSLSPEYAGAVYYGDGSNNVGQLVLEYDSTNKENFYKWTSTQSSLNDYTISIRVKVPDEFTHWDGTAPIQFRYRTNAASADDNQIDITMLDTAGSSVALTGAANLANTSWTTASITGPEGSGTYTPGSYITILITPQARTTNSGEAHVGYLNFNWMTQPR